MRLGARAFIAFQYLVPQHALTALVYWLARCRTRWLKRALIRGFSSLYALDLSEAAEPDADRYGSFNEFFTRALRPGARPLPVAARAIASPCDGTVSERGTLEGEYLLQAEVEAKRHRYTLAQLLGPGSGAADFVGGEFATIYLAPYNYHRVHMPLDGRLVALRYVPGQLFSVNTTTARAVPRLFAQNERVVCRFETALGPCALVFVGALNVGSIEIVGFGALTPARVRRLTDVPLPTPPPSLARGAELGRFNMGSTVILILAGGACRWDEGFAPGAAVRMGATIALGREP